MLDLGVDIGGFPDFDPLGTLVAGNVGLCQRVCRRISNDRGAWSWAPEECTNVLNYLNETLTDEVKSSMQSDIQREVDREDTVQTSDVSVVVSDPFPDLQGQTVTIEINGTTGTGPFQFVLAATSVTLQILKVT